MFKSNPPNWSAFLKRLKVKDHKKLDPNEINTINEWLRQHVKSDFNSNNPSEMEEIYSLFTRLKAKLPLTSIYNKDLNSSLLHEAAKAGFDVFIKNNASENIDWDVTNANKNTPLHLAAAGGHYLVLDFLLEQKANPNLANFKEQLPIYYAIIFLKTHEKEAKSTLTDLLKKTNTFALERQEQCAAIPLLHQIVNIDNLDRSQYYFQAVLKHAPNLKGKKDVAGRNIIHWARISKRPDILLLLQDESELAKELTYDEFDSLHPSIGIQNTETQEQVGHLYQNITQINPNLSFFKVPNLDAVNPIDLQIAQNQS